MNCSYKSLIIAACPDGWVWNPDMSKCYYLLEEYVTWNEANDMCVALDPDGVATLTSIRSEEENNYIVQYIVLYIDNTWIGGNDEAEEGTWRWVNLNMRVNKFTSSYCCSSLLPQLTLIILTIYRRSRKKRKIHSTTAFTLTSTVPA